MGTWDLRAGASLSDLVWHTESRVCLWSSWNILGGSGRAGAGYRAPDVGSGPPAPFGHF